MQKITGKEKRISGLEPSPLILLFILPYLDLVLNLRRLLQREGDVKGADIARNHISGVAG